MPVERTDVDGLLVVRWDTFDDDRGFFRQTYQTRELSDALGREVGFRQGNHARSRPGVLRGFHAEPWDKLVYVVGGCVLAAVADIRPGSPTFGAVRCFRLGDPPHGERIRLFLAEGLANSYLALGEDGTGDTGGRSADYLYDVSAEWTPGVAKRSVAFDDPDLAVDWPVTDPVLSPPDRANPALRELFPDHPRWR